MIIEKGFGVVGGVEEYEYRGYVGSACCVVGVGSKIYSSGEKSPREKGSKARKSVAISDF
jgi:2-keto-3-deoxy-6-phosphogluconate aldolase